MIRCVIFSAFLLISLLLSGCTPTSTANPNDANSGQSTNGKQSTISGRDKGVKEAHEAIARDTLILKEYPPIPYPPGYSVYTQLLREQCGVTFDVIEQPPIGVTHDIFREEISGWNTTMEAEIKRRFGNDIFKKLSREAGLAR